MNLEILTTPSKDANCITIATKDRCAAIIVDTNDFPVVQLAANFFAGDVQRVTGQQPAVTNSIAGAAPVIIAGTLGHNSFIDQLASAGKLKDLDTIKDKWEATLWQIVEKPFPGVDRALVIVGSDRRGAAYGLTQLSERIGVSPWNWWTDVPAKHHDALALKISAPQTDAPGVKYRGIFINDEDWGLNPWASKTFDPKFGNIGPKTYEKVFELMLRLRLNYIWPAMHACTREFASAPENIALADKFGIVAGSSHCEPMLCNNVHWNEKEKGKWNYLLNSNTIHAYWEENVKARGADEAVWTLGIRGIHDSAMQKPPTALPDRIDLVSRVISDQRDLLNQYVTTNFGPVAQCFVPYKEVLPIYDAGLNVPDDVTLVWVDDNFGYIRRLSNPQERKRPGGAGVYWHLSYYGPPHSYTWIDTTAPALMWEELHKAWENDARTLWVINVGDIKPMEMGIDYFSKLSWNPDGFQLPEQKAFLQKFAEDNFGKKFARPMSDLLMDFYRLGTIRKPELMDREWAMSLTPERAAKLEKDYRHLLKSEKSLAKSIPASERDAYTELVGFPVRVLGSAGLIFMVDREIQEGKDVAANTNQIKQLRDYLEAQVKEFNTKITGGKWNHMMPGLVTGKYLSAWNSQVRWPWGEKDSEKLTTNTNAPSEKTWRDAADADRQFSSGAAGWKVVEGLGPSGRAMALLPASLDSSWNETDTNAPTLEYDFKTKSGDAKAFIDFLPTFRIYPGMQLRVAVSVDNQPATIVEVPGSSGAENENGAVRSNGVQDNYVRAEIPLPALAAGKHKFTIRAIDSGAVIDRVSLP
ncbi:MAG TPA: glycosyl hydrolase 115 family protein [Verrucomicrobiae bacterium]|nr:glycosyl hydrolase 115 family protein [Verrucomicrobiae bacterium]